MQFYFWHNLAQLKEEKEFFPSISVHIRVLRNAETETSSHSGLFLLRNEAKWVMMFLDLPSPPLFYHLLFLWYLIHPFLPILPFSHQPLLSYNLTLTLLHLHTSMHLFQPLPRVQSWETGKPEDVVGSQLATKHSHTCSLPELPHVHTAPTMGCFCSCIIQNKKVI